MDNSFDYKLFHLKTEFNLILCIPHVVFVVDKIYD